MLYVCSVYAVLVLICSLICVCSLIGAFFVPLISGFGGWVAPNIYYLGYAGVVRVGGVRIVGISGIYKSGDYHKGEDNVQCPYTCM